VVGRAFDTRDEDDGGYADRFRRHALGTTMRAILQGDCAPHKAEQPYAVPKDSEDRLIDGLAGKSHHGFSPFILPSEGERSAIHTCKVPDPPVVLSRPCMAQRLPAIVADGELNTSVRFGDQRDLDAAMLQQGRSVPQGVIDQFSGNPEERVVKPFGALSGDLNRMRDRLVGRCASGNQIPRERFQWCMKRLGSGCRRDDLGLIAAFGGTNHARQLPSDWPAELAKHLQP